MSVGGGGWQFRGGVSSAHPSETMPLSWPPGEGAVQVGVSVEPAAELAQKEGSRVAEKADFARRVALHLYNFLSSFSASAALPADLIDRWFKRFQDRFQRDPEFLTRIQDA